MISNISETVSFLNKCINKDKRKNLFVLIFFVTIASVLEFLSISAIVPLISTLLNTETTFFFEHLKFISLDQEIIRQYIILAFTVIISFAAIFRVLVLRYSLRFSALVSANIASKIFSNTINQSYKSIVSQNSNVLISGVTEKMNTTGAIIYNLLNFFSSILIGTAITIGLFMYNFKLTAVLVLVFGLMYLIVAYIFKLYLKQNSLVLSKYSDYRVKFMQESIGSIREIILDSLNNIFSKIFSESEKKFRLASANVATVGGSPKIIFETIGIILLLLFCYFFFQGKINQNIELVISLGVFAFAANKLLPLFNTIYIAWVFLSGAQDSILDLKKLFDRFQSHEAKSINNNDFKNCNSIRFKELEFSYFGSRKKIFENLSIDLKLKRKIGITGETGSGKSTFIDLLMGLLLPTNGKVFIDDKELNNKNLRSWQSKISHVPQNIFLINESILKNITFGINGEMTDEQKLMKSIKDAQLDNFIKDLPDGINTEIGENGINISGGQKQRIGIARALYKSKEILILDEATSALDYETEKNIMKNIIKNNKNITLISISHRKESLENFDEVIDLNQLKQKI
tara:strand:+ start:895 stop:2616 length:1722 start_codon:yes stop_codon:yes gene_type:complete